MTTQHSFPHNHHIHTAPYGNPWSLPAGSLGAHTHAFPHTVTISTVVDCYPEVEIKVDETGHYVALVRDKTKEGRVFNKIDIPVIIDRGDKWETLYYYTISLTPEQLIALIKIFTDRWVFVSGDDWEKFLIQYCEDELKKRRECEPFLLHTHEIPSHTHGVSRQDGDYHHSHYATPAYIAEWRIFAS